MAERVNFRAEGDAVFFSHEPTINEDGSKSFSLGGPFCEIWVHLEDTEAIARRVADLLNKHWNE